MLKVGGGIGQLSNVAVYPQVLLAIAVWMEDRIPFSDPF